MKVTTPTPHPIQQFNGNNIMLTSYFLLLKTGLGILDFYHFDWLNGARLSAHIPAATNMVNEHSTTKCAESFFLASNLAIKMDEKNYLTANLN